jgi:3-dehydroquinate dehydratase
MVYRKKRKKGKISKRKSKYKSKGAKAAKAKASQRRSIKTGRAPGEMKYIKAEDEARKKRLSKSLDSQFDDLDREYD